MVKYPSISVVFDRRHVSSESKRGSVEIAVSFGGERVYYSTGVRIFPRQWNGTKKNCKGFSEAVECNAKIRTVLSSIQGKAEELWRGNSFSLARLKLSMEQKKEHECSPVEWIREQAETKNVRPSTKRHIMVPIDAIERCGFFKSWSDFNYRNIVKYDNYVRARGVSQATVHNYHKAIKPFLNEAVKFGFLDRSPYETFKSSRGESESVLFLTEEERDRIEKLVLKDKCEKVRDVFIFSCYTGVSYIDLMHIGKQDIIEKNGAKYLSSNRVKTGNKFLTILPEKAYIIFEKYNFSLPMICNQATNRYLKIIAKSAGVEKRITMHVARHTFATWALHNGIPLIIVSKALGHSSVKTTEIYAKVIDDDVMNEISRLK